MFAKHNNFCTTCTASVEANQKYIIEIFLWLSLTELYECNKMTQISWRCEYLCDVYSCNIILVLMLYV